MNVPIWNIIGFQQRDRQDSQILNNDTFCRLPVTSAQRNISTQKYPDEGILLGHDNDGSSQGRDQTEEASRASKNDILQTYEYHMFCSLLFRSVLFCSVLL